MRVLLDFVFYGGLQFWVQQRERERGNKGLSSEEGKSCTTSKERNEKEEISLRESFEKARNDKS